MVSSSSCEDICAAYTAWSWDNWRVIDMLSTCDDHVTDWLTHYDMHIGLMPQECSNSPQVLCVCVCEALLYTLNVYGYSSILLYACECVHTCRDFFHLWAYTLVYRMRMCTYIHTYIYTCIYIHTYIHTDVCEHTCIFQYTACERVHTYVHRNVYGHIL